MKTTRNDWTLPLTMVCLIMLVLLGTVPLFVAEAQTPRRVVAVYQFNSTIPNISGPTVRDLFIGSLVRSGRFAVAAQNLAGADFIFDGALSEGKAIKGNMKSVLKDMLAGDQGTLSFDVRVVEARTGMLLDYINVTTTDVGSRKLKLADLLRGMGTVNQAAQNNATAEFLAPYVMEAVNRIAVKYGPPAATAFAPGGFPSQPGGFAQPGYPNPSDPYQSGYPSNPQATPGYNSSGYPSTQYPSSPGSASPGSGYPSQPGYPSTGYPPTQYPSNPSPSADPYGYGSQGSGQPGYPSAPYPSSPGTVPSGSGYPPQAGYPSSQYPTQQQPSGQNYPQQGYPSTQYPSQAQPPGQSYPQTAYPSTQYPSSPYPSTDPNQPGYPSSTQPGYPSTQYPAGTPGAPGSAQPGYPSTSYPSQPYVQPRGIGDPLPPPMADLLAKFDPAEHEVGDARAKPGKQLPDGSNLIHTDGSGHRLFAIVEGGQIVEWAATDAQSNPVPLILMGNESSCWECAMSPGLCWKVSCALEEKETASTAPK